MAAPTDAKSAAATPAATTAAAPAASAGATTAAAVEQKRYSLPILSFIKSAQLANGLRHQDYQRYRQYCSRRLRRLRKQLGLLHPRKEFKKKVIEPKHVTDARVLSIPLVSAERAWAYAMQLKADMSDDKENTRLKYHLLRRLQKAAKIAADLEVLCSTCADARTQLEAAAYSTWMKANVSFERNDFAAALQSFSNARTVYEQLGKSVDRATQLLCEERVGTIEPAIKYCRMVISQTGGAAAAAALTSGGSSSSMDAILKAKFDSVLDETRKQQAKSLERVSWHGAQWTVDSEKLRVKYIEAKELLTKFEKKTEAKSDEKSGGARASVVAKSSDPAGGPAVGDDDGGDDNPSSLYVSLLECYDSALNLIRDELKELKKGGETAHSKEKEATLNALRSYTAFSKLRVTGERNLMMAEATARAYRSQEAEEIRLKEAAAAAAAAAAASKDIKHKSKQQKAAAAKADGKDSKSPAAADSKGDAAAVAAATAAAAAAAAAKKEIAAATKKLAQRKRVKPDDVVVLYEKLIQNMIDLSELVPNDKALSAQLNARAIAYKAFRCSYLAEAYRAISKWTESFALYGRTQQLVGTAVDALSKAFGSAAPQVAAAAGGGAGPTTVAADIASLNELGRAAATAQATVHATGVLEQCNKARAARKAGGADAKGAAAAEDEPLSKKAAAAAAARPLLERLNKFEAGETAAAHNLVSFPPNFQAVPCKPTLFDLAFNGISYPNIDARIKAAPKPAATAAAAAAPAPAASKSFLGRLFGR